MQLMKTWKELCYVLSLLNLEHFNPFTQMKEKREWKSKLPSGASNLDPVTESPVHDVPGQPHNASHHNPKPL